MVQIKYRRLPEYKEIQNPINTPQNQKKIKLAASGDYDITNRKRITGIFIQARQRSTRDQSRDRYLVDFPHLRWSLPVSRT
jgi:hypothetical protein